MGLLGAQIQARGGRGNGWTVGLRALQGLHRRDRRDQRCSGKKGEGTTKQTNHRPECRGVVFDLATAREKDNSHSSQPDTQQRQAEADHIGIAAIQSLHAAATPPFQRKTTSALQRLPVET